MHQSPFSIAARLLRISFGISIVFIGFAFYINFNPFLGMVREDLGFLTFFGTVWSFILPGLFIVGGLLLASNMYLEIAAWVTGIALASLPAGLLLKCVVSDIPVSSMMSTADEALLWLFVFVFVIKSSTASDGCCGKEQCRATQNEEETSSSPFA